MRKCAPIFRLYWLSLLRPSGDRSEIWIDREARLEQDVFGLVQREMQPRRGLPI